MTILKVENLTKSYDKFKLDNVSFSLEEGYIMGFIGKNGAGKTTTLKSIFNILSYDSGSIYYKDELISPENELKMKQEIGLSLNGIEYFSTYRLKAILDVTKRFYKTWNNEYCQYLLDKFTLDTNKKYKELSNGMKTKFNLVLALSHDAKLLLLDEPTSGLDPFSRDEILSLFQEIIKNGDKSIIFSTQIISDLEEIADYITYIKNGKIVKSTDKDTFKDSYLLIKGGKEEYQLLDSIPVIGNRITDYNFEALIDSSDIDKVDRNLQIEKPTIEQIMILSERGAR